MFRDSSNHVSVSVNKIINFNLAQKTILSLSLFVFPQLLQYFVYGVYIMNSSRTPSYIDLSHAVWMMKLIYVCAFIVVMFIGVGLLLIRKKIETKWYPIVALSIAGVMLCLFGHQIGMMYIPTGLVLMVAITVGLMLFDVAITGTVIGISSLCILASLYGASAGMFEYSPLLPTSAMVANELDLFWINSIVFFSAPYVLAGFILTAIYINEWRIREERVTQLSLIDPLTEVHNRRSILSQMDIEIERAQRTIEAINTTSCIMIDLDHFKEINDTHGHQAGDAVLSEVALLLKDEIRKTDSVGRYGGEEFIVLLPNTPIDMAVGIAQRCREALAKTSIRVSDGLKLNVTASFGVSSNEKRIGMSSDTLIKYADAALYEAKETGRDRVVVKVPGQVVSKAAS